ncbi:NAD(P)/FAD-dependent oxidoreductase [Microbacterium sp. SSW1-59]|uniref:phytoene desaturase family protein n=1 Tax=Microbacterium xanthum TaxID=3079794 RepID=UPI002AD538FD|nr:NAD(P)/FAD-dependent oxidoreductase [Microbacterium sp. SSW1-59]MDZ8201263.1 NAD(P)/FAD-dependent oxidoreductase [Microbacterium sp. SSW1-59]
MRATVKPNHPQETHLDDAVIIGSGPNGLAAAVTLARAGLRVRVLEAAPSIGGAARTLPLTIDGYRHDVGAAVHPLALASSFFRAFQLDRRVSFAIPEVSYAHPLAGSRGGLAYRSLQRTAAQLGKDGTAWRHLLGPLAAHIDEISDFTAKQMLRVPRYPVSAIRFALRALEQGGPAWDLRFREDTAPALLTGVMAHNIGRLPSLPSAAVGLVLAGHAHARGWPVPIGGTQSIIDAMADDVRAHGGIIEAGVEVQSLRELAGASVVIANTSAKGLARIGAGLLPDQYVRRLGRFRYGNGVAKVDYALSEQVPWSFPGARLSPTVHLGGTRRNMQLAERAVASSDRSKTPYILVSQPTIVDPTRAPRGRHTLWAYMHVPASSPHDPTDIITRAIESHAPGFRDTILASRSHSATQLETIDANLVGGDISSGEISMTQLLSRPVLSPRPWATPVRGVYLASSSTPPASGVHGLAGYYAAVLALKQVHGLDSPPLGLGTER